MARTRPKRGPAGRRTHPPGPFSRGELDRRAEQLGWRITLLLMGPQLNRAHAEAEREGRPYVLLPRPEP